MTCRKRRFFEPPLGYKKGKAGQSQAEPLQTRWLLACVRARERDLRLPARTTVIDFGPTVTGCCRLRFFPSSKVD